MEKWRMPDREELDLMHKKLKLKEIGGFAGSSYWSSSVDYADCAWYQYFDNGNQYSYCKNGIFKVRAVKEFESYHNFEIGEKAPKGIVFWREGNYYKACKPEDEPGKYTWYEVMELFEEKKEEPVLMNRLLLEEFNKETDSDLTSKDIYNSDTYLYVLWLEKKIRKEQNLLPCPFCGEKHIKFCRNENSHFCYCTLCGAQSMTFSVSTPAGAVIENWNKRIKL